MHYGGAGRQAQKVDANGHGRESYAATEGDGDVDAVTTGIQVCDRVIHVEALAEALEVQSFRGPFSALVV